jgi:hypothetical protein
VQNKIPAADKLEVHGKRLSGMIFVLAAGIF